MTHVNAFMQMCLGSGLLALLIMVIVGQISSVLSKVEATDYDD